MLAAINVVESVATTENIMACHYEKKTNDDVN